MTYRIIKYSFGKGDVLKPEFYIEWRAWYWPFWTRLSGVDTIDYGHIESSFESIEEARNWIKRRKRPQYIDRYRQAHYL